jgi:hypothetical protein
MVATVKRRSNRKGEGAGCAILCDPHNTPRVSKIRTVVHRPPRTDIRAGPRTKIMS